METESSTTPQAQTAALEAVQRKLSEQVRSIQEALRESTPPSAISELVDELGSRTKVLQIMRGDLDVLYRRLKSMRQQLQARHPWAFEAEVGPGAPVPGPATLAALDAGSALEALEAWGSVAHWEWQPQHATAS